ncbi:MAG TPA: alkaline phosphatase [Fimbriimonadaceae bacterium]|nr:alkaline phosphatase [Fimbriimonadaceae bacterium]HRJ97660.1 alkaline phosphatase [Fimbriimonadaceae bacterium]
MSLSRRDLLALGATGLASAACSLPSPAQGIPKSKRPKNVIFCVSDGMAASVPTMVDHFQQRIHGKGSYWRWLMNQPFVVNGLQDTRSLNSLVTDSSAASSSWGSGRWIWNGMVNMFPDGTKLRTLTSLLQEAGMRTGLVTTATITHATPAGFAVCCMQRDLEAQIALEYLSSGIHVLLGGGDRFFSAEKRTDKRNLYADFQSRGYTVLRNRDEALSAGDGKLLGIFANGHLPYTVDRDNDVALQRSAPTLAQMARTAIRNLSNANGFLLQIEGARVDHGGHSNDLAAMIHDQIAFEEAVKVAVDFALEDGETLVIITADHATGGVALNGAGNEYIESTAGLESVARMKASYERMIPKFGVKPNAKQVQDVVETDLAVKLSGAEAQAVVDSMDKRSPFRLSSFKTNLQGTLGMVLGNYSKAGFTSTNHTSDNVMVTALGPGKEHCGGLIQNTSFFDVMLAAREIVYKNPTMDFADAQRHYQKLQEKQAGLEPALLAARDGFEIA